jgi:CDGSH iron-sulfur domain-containing protein 3
MEPKIAEKFPIAITVEADKNYSFCTCGHSANQPWCDGAHKSVEGCELKPLRVTFPETKEVWLCQCKHTKNAPFCDGSHKAL